METGKLLVAESEGVYVLKFRGDVRLTLSATIAAFVTHMFENEKFQTVVFDLTETTAIDSTTLGLIAKVAVRMERCRHKVPTIVSTNEDIDRILLSMGFEEVFVIIHEPMVRAEAVGELPMTVSSEDELRDQVLEAHRVLMKLNQKNKLTFESLVHALEREQHLAS